MSNVAYPQSRPIAPIIVGQQLEDQDHMELDLDGPISKRSALGHPFSSRVSHSCLLSQASNSCALAFFPPPEKRSSPWEAQEAAEALPLDLATIWSHYGPDENIHSMRGPVRHFVIQRVSLMESLLSSLTLRSQRVRGAQQGLQVAWREQVEQPHQERRYGWRLRGSPGHQRPCEASVAVGVLGMRAAQRPVARPVL